MIFLLLRLISLLFLPMSMTPSQRFSLRIIHLTTPFDLRSSPCAKSNFILFALYKPQSFLLLNSVLGQISNISGDHDLKFTLQGLQ